MRFKKCKVCGEYHWTNEACPDIYTIYHDDYLGEQGKQIRANSFDGAVEKYGVYYNQDDYSLFDEVITIEVEYNSLRKKFTLSAEPSIYYKINEIK